MSKYLIYLIKTYGTRQTYIDVSSMYTCGTIDEFFRTTLAKNGIIIKNNLSKSFQ